MNRNYRYGSTSLSCIDSVDPLLQKVCVRAQLIANEANPNIYIPDWGYSEGFRSTARQEQLYAQGRTRPGNIVTYVDGRNEISSHQTGRAIDIFAYVDGMASYETRDLHPVILCHMQAAHELDTQIQWGGLFKSFNDSPHIELIP